MSVYSPDRVRRLRLVLAVVVVIAAFVAALAVLILLDGGHRSAGVIAVVVAVLLLGSSATALQQLTSAGRAARPATVTTGLLCLLSGIGLAGSWLAFLLPLVGLGLLFLALLPDDPDIVS